MSTKLHLFRARQQFNHHDDTLDFDRFAFYGRLNDWLLDHTREVIGLSAALMLVCVALA